MDRYHPLKTNATGSPVLLVDTHAHSSQLLDNALLRIRTGVGLLELLVSTPLQCNSEMQTFQLILSAYLPLQDGLDMLEQLQPHS
jgi:PleD family two-component response regulator